MWRELSPNQPLSFIKEEVDMDKSPHTSDFVSVNGIKLHYLDWGGEGDVLLFLAGMGNNAHIFDGFAPRFADKFHVMALTRRGHGQSDHPETGYDVDTLTEDVEWITHHVLTYCSGSLSLHNRNAIRVRLPLVGPRKCSGCSFSPHQHGTPVSGEPFCVCHRTDGVSILLQGFLGVSDDRLTFQEIVYAQRGREAGGPHRGKHVVWTGEVIADRLRRPCSKEDRARTLDQLSHTLVLTGH